MGNKRLECELGHLFLVVHRYLAVAASVAFHMGSVLELHLLEAELALAKHMALHGKASIGSHILQSSWLF